MNRREFLGWVGVGSVASSLPIAIAACSPQQSSAPLPPARPDGFRPVGTVSELKQKSHLLNQQVANAPVLVVQNPSSPNTPVAVNPTCPHKGCIVEWKTDQNAFVCPCHDAKFAVDGKALQGPTQDPLPVYQTKVEEGSILIATKA